MSDYNAKENFSQYEHQYSRMMNKPPSELYSKSDLENYNPSWMKGVPIDATILDIGAGYGHQLYKLNNRGFKNLHGIEVAASSLAVAMQELPADVKFEFIDAFEYLPSHQSEFDVIILNDVLEHIPREKTIDLLLLINSALKNGGRLIVRVPNMSSILAQYSMCMDFTHIVGFTEFSLMQVFDSAGFNRHQVVKTKFQDHLSGWRPWRPLRGLGLKKLLNDQIHKFFYSIRCQDPKPTVFDYNLEMVTFKNK